MHLSRFHLSSLVCMLAGDSNAEIARFLELSESSVKRYVRQLKVAAGAHGRVSLTAGNAPTRPWPAFGDIEWRAASAW